MDGAPMSEECIVIDRVILLEEDGNFDTFYEIALGIVVELGGVELVLNLFEGHIRFTHFGVEKRVGRKAANEYKVCG